MRILWHSLAAPWVGSGYGTQTAVWARYFRGQGHEVAISVGFGHQGSQTEWEDIPVLPAPLDGQVHVLLPHYARQFKPDVTITLCDIHPMPPELLASVPGKVLAWIPVDTMRDLSLLDFDLLSKASNVQPVAMSRHGQALLARRGFVADYIPHAIDTFEAWTPSPDRAGARELLGLPPDTFIIGINSNNSDPWRKGYHEQFEAFRLFTEAHPKVPAALAVHAFINQKGSANLLTMAIAVGGIRDRIYWADQTKLETGWYNQDYMAEWWSCMDVASNCSLGEGFGLAAIEAQACGTPVILSRGSTGPELVGPGWLVNTQPFYNPTHQAQWHMPLIEHLAWTYGQAWKEAGKRRDKARDFATAYDIAEIGPRWDELLATL